MQNLSKMTWFLAATALFLAGNLVFTACEKGLFSEEIAHEGEISKIITQEQGSQILEIITEEYVYKGKTYVLEYKDQKDDVAVNKDVADKLKAVTEGKELHSVRYASKPIRAYLFDNEGEYETFLYGNTTPTPINVQPNKTAKTEQVVPFMKFFEDINFSGSSLIGENVSQVLNKGTNNCATAWVISDLTSSGWNDRISSWEIRRQVVVTDPLDRVAFEVYRDPGFPTQPCYREGWVVDVNNFDADDLTRPRWCVFGSRLNDAITGWAASLCRKNCNDCYLF